MGGNYTPRPSDARYIFPEDWIRETRAGDSVYWFSGRIQLLSKRSAPGDIKDLLVILEKEAFYLCVALRREGDNIFPRHQHGFYADSVTYEKYNVEQRLLEAYPLGKHARDLDDIQSATLYYSNALHDLQRLGNEARVKQIERIYAEFMDLVGDKPRSLANVETNRTPGGARDEILAALERHATVVDSAPFNDNTVDTLVHNMVAREVAYVLHRVKEENAAWWRKKAEQQKKIAAYSGTPWSVRAAEQEYLHVAAMTDDTAAEVALRKFAHMIGVSIVDRPNNDVIADVIATLWARASEELRRAYGLFGALRNQNASN